jgi:hypothetical protein
MPVEKFRSLDEARRALEARDPSADLARRVRALWAWADRLSPRRLPRGVRKFATIEDANRDRSP